MEAANRRRLSHVPWYQWYGVCGSKQSKESGRPERKTMFGRLATRRCHCILGALESSPLLSFTGFGSPHARLENNRISFAPVAATIARPLSTTHTFKRHFSSQRPIPKKVAHRYMKQIKETRYWKDALQIIDDVEKAGFVPNLFLYNAAINKCAFKGRWREAMRLYERMIQNGIDPDAFTFSTLINTCGRGGRTDVALALWDELQERQVKPNEFVYASLISACEKGGAKYTGTALKFYADMSNSGLKPNLIALSAAISACEKGGRRYTDAALDLLDAMGDIGLEPDVIVYSAAISSCEKGGPKYTQRALSLLVEMKSKRIKPNVFAYSSAISACEKGGGEYYTGKALYLYEEMKGAGVNPTDVTYNAITQACFNSKRYLEALELAREAKGRGVLLMKITKENGLPKWDLHELIEAMACMLISDALLSFGHLSNDGTSRNSQDIIVVTGKGLNTEGPNGPVLREKVPQFLNDIAGLETTAMEGNEGRFLITAESLDNWVASGAYNKFQSLL